MPVLADGELVDRQPVVVVRVVEVEHPRLRAADGAVGRAVLDRHAVDQQAMEGAVARLQRWPLGAGELAEGIVEGLGRKRGVEPRECSLQPLRQHDLPVVGALGGQLARRNLGAVLDRPAEAFQPGEGGFFDDRL